MKKVKRHILLPALLLAYLAFMMLYFGVPAMRVGQMSVEYFAAVSASTLLVIVLLYFSLKRRDRLRREREDDINRTKDAL